MLQVILTLIKKEVIQTFRDKRMVAILFIAPLIQTTIFGFAVNMDLKEQPTVVCDLDRTPASREVIQSIQHAESFKLVASVYNEDQAQKMVWKGNAVLAVFIPRGYGKDLAAGDAELMVAVDGSDANTAVRAGQEIGQILNNRALLKIKQKMPNAQFASIQLAPRAMFNPQLKTAIFLVPGVLGMVLLLITMMLTSMGRTREKELGTLEQVMVSPLKPFELVIGKTVPFAVAGLADVMLVISLAVLVFDVPLRGSIPSLLGASGLFLMTTLGLGLFISTVSSTQQQAMMNTFFVMLPCLMLSGFIFPVENMPEAARWLCHANPLTYYIEIVRAVMVKGATLADLTSQVATLAAMGVAVMLGAALRFKKRVA